MHRGLLSFSISCSSYSPAPFSLPHPLEDPCVGTPVVSPLLSYSDVRLRISTKDREKRLWATGRLQSHYKAKSIRATPTRDELTDLQTTKNKIRLQMEKEQDDDPQVDPCMNTAIKMHTLIMGLSLHFLRLLARVFTWRIISDIT